LLTSAADAGGWSVDVGAPSSGARPRHLTVASALDRIAGYACFNDGSVRKFQRRTSQWDIGENFDQTDRFGPLVVSSDALPAGAKGLKLECRLNGRVMHSDNTANMVFSAAEALADVTQAIMLDPGDLLVSGTPHWDARKSDRRRSAGCSGRRITW